MHSILWQPSDAQIHDTHMAKFSAKMARKHHLPSLENYADLHQFSLQKPTEFWQGLIEYAELKAQHWGENYCDTFEKPYKTRFFPKAKLNLAENLLPRNDDGCAIKFFAENQYKNQLSWKQLNQQVSCLQQALKKAGLKIGDRVCAITPNCPEAIIIMLATHSLGGVFSSVSPDFGSTGILERFAQIKPKFLFCADGYWYMGKQISIRDKTLKVIKQIPSIKKVIDFPLTHEAPMKHSLAETWQDFLTDFTPKALEFVPLPFHHPAFILFSSGTTGKPKCFVHACGSYLLSNRVDLMLHNDVRANDTTMFFTTCGWMMWNWLVGALGIGSSIILYDGSPLASGSDTLFALADQENATLLGVSPKLLSLAEKANISIKQQYPLENLRRICTTGSPLSPNNFHFVYQHIKQDVHLAPISGGTDILGCFLGGEPRKPVHLGEMQVALLGKDVVSMDDKGQVLTQGTGELVCRNAFIGMPNAFWDDPEDHRYQAAYFDKFDQLWCHGDYLETTATGYVIQGRSDTVLNPGGVRIGTAEIYNALTPFSEIADAVCVGQQWQDDVRIVLFLELSQGVMLEHDLCQRIKKHIKNCCSPRHVPAIILSTPAIARTRSGKISEKAIVDTIHGRPINNQEALVNPEALVHFTNRKELQV